MDVAGMGRFPRPGAWRFREIFVTVQRAGRMIVTIALLGAAFGAGVRAASARQEPRHPALLTGTEWKGFGFQEKQAYLDGFIAGAAAEQVRALTTMPAGTSDSSAVSSGAIAKLRAAKRLDFPYAPTVYSAQLDDYYWWTDHAATPIVDVMITVNRQMQTP
jgi:hypothetical protein